MVNLTRWLAPLIIVVFFSVFIPTETEAASRARGVKRTDVYFGLPQVRLNNPAIVGVPNTLIFKVCGKALDSSTTVTTTLVAGEPGERVITKVTVSDSLDRFGTCVLARVPWTPSLPGVVTITATLNGNRKVSEGIWIFNNYMAWPIVVSNGS